MPTAEALREIERLARAETDPYRREALTRAACALAAARFEEMRRESARIVCSAPAPKPEYYTRRKMA